MTRLSSTIASRRDRVRDLLPLVIIVAIAAALRAGYLAFAMSQPGFEWSDPDGYLILGHDLTPGGRWKWTWRAVDYRQFVKAPAYPAILGFFALFPGYPFSVAVAQVVAEVAAVPCLYWIGAAMHSRRAGLIAAGCFAVVQPPIVGATTFLQEHFYTPLVLAGFAALFQATAQGAPRWWYGVAGVTFGIAALVRSMPIYFVPLAALYLSATRRGGEEHHDRPDRRGLALLVAGVAVTVLPYAVAISMHLGRPTLIDNQGMYELRYSSARPLRPAPGLIESAGILWEELSAAPGEFVYRRIDWLSKLLQIRGPRWLQTDGLASTPYGAAALKAVTHVSFDALYLAALVLAPVGWALAHRRREATLLGLWCVLNAALVVMFRWSSARYRAPFEPHLLALAAVLASRPWRLPSRPRLVAAAIFALTAAALSGPHLASIYGARAEYGISRWNLADDDGRQTVAAGPAGFHVLSEAGIIRFSVRPLDRAAPDGRIEVRVDGRTVDIVTTRRGETSVLRYGHQEKSLRYVELSGDPAAFPLRIVVPTLAR